MVKEICGTERRQSCDLNDYFDERTFETFTFTDQNNIRFSGNIEFANAKETNAKANSKRKNNQNKLKDL